MSGHGDSKRCVRAGLLTALAPATLAYLGAERLALLTLIVIGPFALGLWLRSARIDLEPWRAAATVMAIVLFSNGVVFAEYRLLDPAGLTAPTQWLGLAAATLGGVAVAALGDRVGLWARRRARARTDRLDVPVDSREALDRPSPAAFCEECPACGTCHAAGSSRCDRDGVALFPLNVPHVLAGRYQLQHRLGRGGMSTVYAAFDRTLNREIAIKLVRDDLDATGRARLGDSDQGAAQRFLTEARAAASFNHPNVVTVFDYGLSGSQAFLVMELLEGRTLRDALRVDARLPACRVLAIVRDLTAAVEAAHARQLVHRDLKPENVWLVRNAGGERAKVLDFGLAGIVAADEPEPLARWTGGQLVGTPLYMAPEQIRGEAPQPAWDLWALTVMTFEMLCGEHPFSGLLEPDSEHPRSGLSDGLRAFFDRSLAVDVSARPKSAARFLEELEEHLHG